MAPTNYVSTIKIDDIDNTSKTSYLPLLDLTPRELQMTSKRLEYFLLEMTGLEIPWIQAQQ